ncbi:MAG: hypothetical protein ACRDRF_22935 [Pseudonocardiaceae bacterium]
MRAREDVRGDLMSARHRLSKLLLRQGFVYYQGKAWTGVHDRWLRAQHFTSFDARRKRAVVGQRRDRPRARRLVLVAGRPGLTAIPLLPPSLIVSRRLSVSTSSVLAALRALHVDTSPAARSDRQDGGRGTTAPG